METAEQKEQFEEYLSSRGLMWTPERKAILEQVFATHEHFEADDLLLRLKKENIRISRATIYRTLELLVKSRLVRKVTFGENHTHYEHTYGHKHHDHLICLKCGNVLEFTNPNIEQLQIKVCEDYDFELDSHCLQIFGLCAKCR
ncbi:MAG: Fur family transcriptional regulator [Candidatus Binatia bacterium]